MTVNFSGFSNSGHMVIKSLDSKGVKGHCVWASMNNIGKRDLEKSEELLKEFPSNTGALFLEVDTRNIPLKDSSIKVNGVNLDYSEKNFGKISKVAKFLKNITSTKDELFSLDLNYLDNFKKQLLVSPTVPEKLKQTSVFNIHDTIKVKKIAKIMLRDVETKVVERLKVKKNS